MIRRVQRELRKIELEPPPGILAWPIGDDIAEIEARTRFFFFCRNFSNNKIVFKQNTI
jgi:hypothetical protein